MNYSVIIPHRDSLDTLPRLFNSIPESDDIEIILVDNTPTPITKMDIGVNRDYKLLWSDPSRHAGGARNVGMEQAQGKWIIFADADDYFVDNAFDIFNEYVDNSDDIIYFSVTGIFSDTGMYSQRGERYSNLIKGYLDGSYNEMDLRLMYHTPWAKMIRHSFVVNYAIRFDEVRASNDVFFSTKSGLLARRISAVDRIVYIVTVSSGSLTRRRTFDVCNSRFLVTLRRNQYLRLNGLSKYQDSILIYFYQAKSFGISNFFRMIGNIIKYRQNPFVGWKTWYEHMKEYRMRMRDEKKYIVK